LRGYERVARVGNLLLAGVGIVLVGFLYHSSCGRWGTLAIAVLVVIAAVALFPRQRPDGSTASLINAFGRA
jgi:hypothetical protein